MFFFSLSLFPSLFFSHGFSRTEITLLRSYLLPRVEVGLALDVEAPAHDCSSSGLFVRSTFFVSLVSLARFFFSFLFLALFVCFFGRTCFFFFTLFYFLFICFLRVDFSHFFVSSACLVFFALFIWLDLFLHFFGFISWLFLSIHVSSAWLPSSFLCFFGCISCFSLSICSAVFLSCSLFTGFSDFISWFVSLFPRLYLLDCFLFILSFFLVIMKLLLLLSQTHLMHFFIISLCLVIHYLCRLTLFLIFIHLLSVN